MLGDSALPSQKRGGRLSLIGVIWMPHVTMVTILLYSWFDRLFGSAPRCAITYSDLKQINVKLLNKFRLINYEYKWSEICVKSSESWLICQFSLRAGDNWGPKGYVSHWRDVTISWWICDFSVNTGFVLTISCTNIRNNFSELMVQLCSSDSYQNPTFYS